ncbi:hypothetical protein [Agromyces aerolatus]|uniref:hypothetical protein n=1 Tax=Agromyces sp. LY-1074 TaxID=3074080 RepID=UPI0028546CBB|nr:MULTISPECIES: hypothetical protein [unclassified Agromyces]MDR5699027.1 hypothetical protein [Agromyces sp. LY-1074]MDR5705195.1 hypothetical protein [Agromyces sp. LY-1358]
MVKVVLHSRDWRGVVEVVEATESLHERELDWVYLKDHTVRPIGKGDMAPTGPHTTYRAYIPADPSLRDPDPDWLPPAS